MTLGSILFFSGIGLLVLTAVLGLFIWKKPRYEPERTGEAAPASAAGTVPGTAFMGDSARAVAETAFMGSPVETAPDTTPMGREQAAGPVPETVPMQQTAGSPQGAGQTEQMP